jgi:hypothetical protein
MKIGRLLFALVAFGGLAMGYAHYHPAMAKTVAKPAASSQASPHGSVGGAASKTGGINGTAKPKH